MYPFWYFCQWSRGDNSESGVIVRAGKPGTSVPGHADDILNAASPDLRYRAIGAIHSKKVIHPGRNRD